MKQILKITKDFDKNNKEIYSTSISGNIEFTDYLSLIDRLSGAFIELQNEKNKMKKTENKKTEMAQYIIDDGQAIRSIWNYLSQTFDDLKDVELFDTKFENREVFYEFVKNVCEMMLEANKEELLDNN